ncbi:hypothetical protein V2J09_010427 [Rumex salicifolius]
MTQRDAVRYLCLPANMVHPRENAHGSEELNRSMVTLNESQDRSGGTIKSPKNAIVPVTGDIDIEPHNGIEFESHEFAYKFYQEYAKSMGFTTSIKNSRRSKKSKDFIDAKFACSRYGVTPESDTSSSRRPSVRKTDCKASMHVKRNKDGKWLAEKNNIDILHAVSERTKKMYVEMSRQSVGIRNIGFLRDDTEWQFEKVRHLVLEEGDAQMLFEFFMRIKKNSPMFFYAINLNEEQQLRNLFWVDGKSRSDYAFFNDVVFFDISYLRNADKMPLALFVGVNNHFQPMLLGCALLADETRTSFVWLMKTWLRAMNGISPEVLVTEQHCALSAAIMDVFPKTRHCFPLWNILEKVPEKLDHKMTLKEFVKQYGAILQNRHEEEAVADFDTWHKQPALKSPSPWEKQMSMALLDVIPKRKVETMPLQFIAHAMIVLQLCGVSSIPSQYILNRWTKDARNHQLKSEGTDKMQTRVQRYNDLCKMAIDLSEVGSLSQENYDVAFRAIVEILKNCVNVNNSNESAAQLSVNASAVQDVELGYQGSFSGKLGKKKNTVKRRKVPVEPDALISETEDSLQQMETLNSDGISLNGFYGTQHNVQGLVQLNLMEPPNDNYYVSQGLGQLHSIAPTHEEFFGAQQSVNGMGHLDFRPHTSFTYNMQDDHNLRTTQHHGDASRHT